MKILLALILIAIVLYLFRGQITQFLHRHR